MMLISYLVWCWQQKHLGSVYKVKQTKKSGVDLQVTVSFIRKISAIISLVSVVAIFTNKAEQKKTTTKKNYIYN